MITADHPNKLYIVASTSTIVYRVSYGGGRQFTISRKDSPLQQKILYETVVYHTSHSQIYTVPVEFTVHLYLELVVQSLDVVLHPLDELRLVLTDGPSDVSPHEEGVVTREDAEHFVGVFGHPQLGPSGGLRSGSPLGRSSHHTFGTGGRDTVHKLIATSWHINRVLFNLHVNAHCVTNSHNFFQKASGLPWKKSISDTRVSYRISRGVWGHVPPEYF